MELSDFGQGFRSSLHFPYIQMFPSKLFPRHMMSSYPVTDMMGNLLVPEMEKRPAHVLAWTNSDDDTAGLVRGCIPQLMPTTIDYHCRDS